MEQQWTVACNGVNIKMIIIKSPFNPWKKLIFFTLNQSSVAFFFHLNSSVLVVAGGREWCVWIQQILENQYSSAKMAIMCQCHTGTILTGCLAVAFHWTQKKAESKSFNLRVTQLKPTLCIITVFPNAFPKEQIIVKASHHQVFFFANHRLA